LIGKHIRLVADDVLEKCDSFATQYFIIKDV